MCACKKLLKKPGKLIEGHQTTTIRLSRGRDKRCERLECEILRVTLWIGEGGGKKLVPMRSSRTEIPAVPHPAGRAKNL